MKPRFLSLDTSKMEQPQGSYPYGKNGIWNANINAEENENGFLQSNVNTPYPIIGVIETDTYPLYFSTDNTNSAFGFHNTDTDSYNAVFDDATLSFKLGFSTARPIKGEYRRNFRNEIELTWIELGTGANPPRWANTNNIGSDLNDFLLFPKCLIPYIDTTLQPGGNLSMGAYFFGAKYISNDGTETRYTTLTRPLIAFSDNYDTIPGTNTGKAITLNVTGIDLTYDRLGLVVVERINGVDTPYELPDQAIAPNITFVYTGAEKSTQLTMDEVLIPSAYYENAQAISQLTDQLFLANMTEETVIDWQQYANMVTIRWKSELVNVASRPNIPTESGKQRGWMHSEVGAFYIVLKLRTGRNSRAFTIPGPAPLSSDLLQSAYATAQGLTAAVYQIEDTCRNLQSDNTGDCGIWINNDESYPDIIQFDSTSIGGENLRGQPVRHHRMPSLRFCKTNLYGSQPEYGRTMLDTIGLEVTNVIIPSDLQDQVIGWELHYAERNFNNAMVLGQSLLMFGAQANSNAAGGGGITSTGGNWGSWQRTHGSGAITDPESLKLVNNYIRFHAFDLLYFRPSITPSYIDLQLGMVANFTGGANIAYDKSDEVLMDVDYTNGQNNISVPATRPDNEHIYAIEDGQYVINNGNSGDYMNTRLEEAFVAKLPTPGTNLMNSLGWGYMKRDYDKGNNNITPFELTYLTNLMLIKANVYLNYFSQTLVRTGQVFPSTLQGSDTTIYGGDTFLSVYTYITYGLVTNKDVVDNTGIESWQTTDVNGIKANHRFICETVGDVACRYETPGNDYSQFWPKSSMANGTNSFLYNFSRSVEPNQIGYSRDCNSVGDLLNGILIASPYDQFVQQSPTKIVRSEKQVSESVINSWKNFNALDYYEAVKNKGPIINLCGFNDRLIIHHQNALFLTRSKATINTDITQITLGTGDIFQFDPNEVRPAHLGYGGTSNPLACVLTPIGYIFPDSLTGELFLFDGGNLTNIGSGVITFLLKYLTVKDINSFFGNGVTIGFEQYYKRLLLTVKNIYLTSGGSLVFVPGYVETPEFFATLTANVSVVYKDGRYQLFKGINSSAFNCNAAQYPVLGNYNFTSNEHVPNGTVIGTVAATGGILPYTYLIVTANRAGLGIDPLTGIITVIDTTAFDYTQSVLSLQVRVIDNAGSTATGNVNVTINHVASVPVLPAYNVTIPEHSPNGTVVNTEVATDRDGKSITYSITGGNGAGAFAINATTGIVTVVNGTILDYFSTNPYTLTIRATASDGSYDENTLTIGLSFVHQPPIVTNDTFSVIDTAVNGTVVGTITPATQRTGQSGYLVYALVTDSVPAGAFQVITDEDDVNYLNALVLSNTLLDPLNNVYVITMEVYDPSFPADISNFTVSITVYYDPALLTSEEYQYTCSY